MACAETVCGAVCFTCVSFFFNDTATTEIYTLSLHDALPISCGSGANVVYCSEAAQRRNPVSGVSSIVIPNGIVRSPYLAPCALRAETRRSLGIPNGAVAIIAVGRMWAHKKCD